MYKAWIFISEPFAFCWVISTDNRVLFTRVVIISNNKKLELHTCKKKKTEMMVNVSEFTALAYSHCAHKKKS